MPAQVSLHVVLEPSPRESRIEGHVHDERGVEHPFSSWLGLLSLLEAARDRARASARAPVVPTPGAGLRDGRTA